MPRYYNFQMNCSFDLLSLIEHSVEANAVFGELEAREATLGPWLRSHFDGFIH
jgi:hypothetical protein